MDHVNNVPATVAGISAAIFMDHGDAAAKDPGTAKAVAAYLETTAKAKRNGKFSVTNARTGVTRIYE